MGNSCQRKEKEYKGAFRPTYVFLHAHMGIQMVQSTVRLGASGPVAMIQALNFVVSSSRSLLLVCAGNSNK